jgi:LPS-assembly lipoprotein
MSNPLKTFFVFSLLLTLASCGFHLRGMVELPPSFQHVFISAPPQGRSLVTSLDEQLQAYRVAKASCVSDAAFQIVIDDIQFERQISNISSSTTPRQYQLFYIVKYHLIDTHGEHLIPNGLVKSNRLVSMNSERLLGSNFEQDFFLHEMEVDAARQIMTCIGTYFAKQS